MGAIFLRVRCRQYERDIGVKVNVRCVRDQRKVKVKERRWSVLFWVELSRIERQQRRREWCESGVVWMDGERAPNAGKTRSKR